MEIQRIAVEIMEIQRRMDELIEKWESGERAALQEKLLDDLLELKRAKDRLYDNI
jgi:hypothetical protein